MIHHEAMSFIDVVDTEDDPARLVDRYTQFTRKIDFKAYILTGLPAIGSNVEPLIIAADWPKAWMDRYRDRDFFVNDPVARWSRSRQRAFRWADAIAANPGYETTEIALEAAAFGFVDGIAIPLRSERMWKVVASLASDQPLALTASEIAHIETATAYFYQRHEDIIAKSALKRPTLTPREVEVLKWCAAGKSAWEIGKIIGISEATTVIHRKSAIKKLECSNTTQAVVIAIEAGLIKA